MLTIKVMRMNRRGITVIPQDFPGPFIINIKKNYVDDDISILLDEGKKAKALLNNIGKI